jgi:hypothetical protein
VIKGVVIVEIKAPRGLDNGVLAVSGCQPGLLFNIGERNLAHRRVFPRQKVIDDLVNHQWLFVPERLKQENAQKEVV